MNLTLNDFLLRNNVSQESWDASGCDWDSMLEIANDHESNYSVLVQSADFFAKLVQAFPVVHSVRWRVKDPEHLIEKIVRKRAAGAEKYSDINLQNYYTVVTDLIGIRALHLFKDDCFAIDCGFNR
jgi:ppGpp synthetase/RelA/SpoT-type nucleotidyltranferase